MNPLVEIAGLLLALLVLPVAVRLLAVACFGGAIGRRALARQPDQIRLVPAGPEDWRDGARVRALSDPLVAAGFASAGAFRIAEMPGVMVQLLAQPAEQLLAAVYEHPVGGHWIEITARFTDGGSQSATGLPSSGLADRPGHVTLRAPGDTPLGLLARLRAALPAGSRCGVSVSNAVHTFEQRFAEGMAWRKEHGVSRAEIARVKVRRAA